MKAFTSSSRIIAVSLLALSIASTGSAIAQTTQTAPTAEKTGIDTVVVTAQRREQNLQDTPVAVTALTEAALQNQQITSTQDIARAVPNLIMNPVTANPSTFQIGLRGGSEQTSGLIVSEPVVGLYVDDVYRGRLQGANFQLTDIERIEVLRGPQGTLYGRNTFSGAVKIVTKTPSQTNSWFNASLGAGSFNEVRGDASIGGPLTEQLAGSLSVFYRDQADGWIFNRALNRKVGAERNLAGRAKLAWDSGPWTVVGSVSYTTDRNDGYIPVNVRFVPDAARVNFASRVRTRDAESPFGSDAYVTSTPTVSRGETDVFSATLSVDRKIGDMTLRSITGYVDTDDLFRWDLAGGTGGGSAPFRSTFDRLAIANAKQWSQEIQLSGKSFDNKLNWIAGLYYFSEKGEQTFSDTLGIFFLPTFPLFSQRTDTKSAAAFVHGTFNLTDATAITAGLRYTNDDKKFAARIAPPANVAVTLSRKDEALTPKIGLEHTFSDRLFGYVSVERGFKAGGFNGLSRDPRTLALSYRPQKVWAYEAGLKAEFLDRTLRTNLAVFYNSIKDLQQTTTRPDGTFPQENVGDATVWGVELEVNARPTPGLNLFAIIGYQDDKFDRLNPASDAFIAKAQNLPLVSDWTARFGGTWERPISQTLSVRAGGSIAYVGKYDATVTNVLEISDYARTDGFIALGTIDGRWELNLSGQNLSDEVTYVSGIVSPTFPPALTALKPRTFMLSLKYRR